MSSCNQIQPPSTTTCTPPNNYSTIFQCIPGTGTGTDNQINYYSPCLQGTVSYQNVMFSTQNLYSVNIPATFNNQTIAIPAVFKSATPILNFIISSDKSVTS